MRKDTAVYALICSAVLIIVTFRNVGRYGGGGDSSDANSKVLRHDLSKLSEQLQQVQSTLRDLGKSSVSARHVSLLDKKLDKIASANSAPVVAQAAATTTVVHEHTANSNMGSFDVIHMECNMQAGWASQVTFESSGDKNEPGIGCFSRADNGDSGYFVTDNDKDILLHWNAWDANKLATNKGLSVTFTDTPNGLTCKAPFGQAHGRKMPEWFLNTNPSEAAQTQAAELCKKRALKFQHFHAHAAKYHIEHLREELLLAQKQYAMPSAEEAAADALEAAADNSQSAAAKLVSDAATTMANAAAPLVLADEADEAISANDKAVAEANSKWFEQGLGPARPADSTECKTLDDNGMYGQAQQITDKMRIWTGAVKTKPRILCGIYTNAGGKSVHGDGESRLPLQQAVMDTWGTRCDKMMFYSDKPLPDGIPHIVIDKLDVGEEGYYNMWQKVRSIWRYVHEHFAEDFDFFTMHGDDVYYAVENLRQFLLSPSVQQKERAGEPLFMGRRLAYQGGSTIFNTGGASYVLNRKALDKLAAEIHSTSNKECPHAERSHQEDVNVARCLKSVGVLPMDTRDHSDGSERFHMLSPDAHYVYRIGNWGPSDWFASYSKPFDLQVCDTDENRCASRSSITFHYCNADYMRFLEQQLETCRA